jgi:hypothetical protein
MKTKSKNKKQTADNREKSCRSIDLSPESTCRLRAFFDVLDLEDGRVVSFSKEASRDLKAFLASFPERLFD